MPTSTALVLGATGAFGGAMLAELAARGYRVRALARDPARLQPRLKSLGPIQVIAGDATEAPSVAAAARGATVIVHGVNYPYDQWIPHMRRVTDAVIGAAESEGATILFPGNVYGFGPSIGRPFVESDPFRPNTRKGKLRVELEELLAAAASRGRARVLIVRAGDYFGPTARNGLVDPIFGNAARHKPMRMLGDLDIPHQWAFVPDFARFSADLLAISERLRPFELVHFKGDIVKPGRDIGRLAAAGAPDLALRGTPWWLLRLAGLFNGVARELMEMRYLFDTSVIIDDPRRRELLPDFKPTPLKEAVAETVASYRE